MPDTTFDPTQTAPEQLRVLPAPEPALDREALKLAIAGRIRADSRDRGALTPEPAIEALAPALSTEELSALLAEMSEDERFADVKGIVAPSGRVYLFSSAHLAVELARERGRAEEAMLAIASRVREDSRRLELTPLEAVEPLFPWPEAEKRAALLAELQADPRFADVQRLSGARGELFLHSDRHLSGNYGKILVRAKAGDPCAGIAELVRDRARNLPRPTRIDLFEDPVFAIEPSRIAEVVEETLRRPEYTDLVKMVHPETGSVYLYSTLHLTAESAFQLMDWDEVGALRNP